MVDPAVLDDLWDIRDEVSVIDGDLAAQIHSIYNRLVVEP